MKRVGFERTAGGGTCHFKLTIVDNGEEQTLYISTSGTHTHTHTHILYVCRQLFIVHFEIIIACSDFRCKSDRCTSKDNSQLGRSRYFCPNRERRCGDHRKEAIGPPIARGSHVALNRKQKKKNLESCLH